MYGVEPMERGADKVKCSPLLPSHQLFQLDTRDPNAARLLQRRLPALRTLGCKAQHLVAGSVRQLLHLWTPQYGEDVLWASA